MEKSNKVELGTVQETMLFMLWTRAMETQKKKPVLIDNKAVEVVNSIPYDFTMRAKASRIYQIEWLSRCIYFDEKIKTFIDLHPDATIINIGCGLDTTFYRVDNGKIKWINIDLPEVIDLRKGYFPESERDRLISKSIFDTSWYDSVENKDNIMLLIAGVLYYFDESQVKRLFNDFQIYLPGAEMVFDATSKLMMKMSNRSLKKRGMDVRLSWGISNIYEIEKWNSGLEVIEVLKKAGEHKQHFHLMDRIILTITDLISTFINLSSFAHVKINPL